ncbi:hypothetical protein C1H46_036614 [Malus baccata]|uniref:Uncharacterized protein n=1 Tax=Malus baccata TaxID=106549 RepID=A0A540KUI6_MALBA|nr:hypothetical protein C1H46_036614 [Malus baccata]
MLVLVSEKLLIWKYGSLLIGPYLYVIYGSSSTLVRFRSTSAFPRGTSLPRCSHRAEVSPALRCQNQERFSSPVADPRTLYSARLEAERAQWSGMILGEMNGVQWMGCQVLSRVRGVFCWRWREEGVLGYWWVRRVQNNIRGFSCG